MAFSPGYKAYIGLDNAAGSVQNVSQYADDITFPQSVEMLETTTFGTVGAKRFIPGLVGGDSISVGGPLDTTLHSQIAGMLAAQAAGTAGFSILYGPAGSVSGAIKQTAEVYVASYEVSSGVGGRGEYSASLQIDAAVTNGTW